VPAGLADGLARKEAALRNYDSPQGPQSQLVPPPRSPTGFGFAHLILTIP